MADEKTTTHIAHRSGWVGALIAIGLIVVCCVGIYFLSADARREINALATANSDSTQWALAQTEVELLSLEVALLASDAATEPGLRQIRRRFDVFYSRVVTLRDSAVFAQLRETGAATSEIEQLWAFLDRSVPLIDGPDAVLIEALPDFAADVHDVRGIGRSVSLAGVEQFSKVSDQQRQRVSLALIRLGILTFALFTALSAVVLALAKLIRTSRREAAEKADTQRRLEAIIATSLDAIIVVDRPGRVLSFNQAAERVFGYDEAEVIGQPLTKSIIPDHFVAAHEAGMSRYARTGERRVVGQGRVQLEARHKSGRIFPVELSISSAQGADGEIFVSFLRDISNRVTKQKELTRARDEAVAGEQAKAEMMAIMSHEMRTPLNGILGALDILDKTKLGNKQRELTSVMGTSGRMLLHHVNDVLDISRLEAGSSVDNIRSYDPVFVTNEVLESLQVSAKKQGNKLHLDLMDEDFGEVVGDPSKLRQVVTNLVGNAIKFTRGGFVSVELQRHEAEGQWELRVTDNGIGISQEDQERIFDDFVTLDPSYKRAHEGTGLGLAIVRRLAEHSGGTFGVESSVGDGSVFWVRLPLNGGGLAVPVPETPSVPETETHDLDAAPLRILMVEDNAINRFVAGEMLTKLGHTVTEAQNGIEGVEAAGRDQFDLILMDISMPQMDGVEATKAIRASQGHNADTPIVALTAHALPSDLERFRDVGMVDAIVKPINADALSATIGMAVGGGDMPSVGEGEALVDMAIFGDLRDAVGAKGINKLVSQFIAEMDEAVERMGHAAFWKNLTQAKSEVHKLVGSASVFGASHLLMRLRQIEEEPHRGQMALADEADRGLVEVWAETKAELMKLGQ